MADSNIASGAAASMSIPPPPLCTPANVADSHHHKKARWIVDPTLNAATVSRLILEAWSE
jgi:hypothetical protein